MTGPSVLQVGLRATARAEGDRCLLTITVTLTNNGENPIAPGIFASELLIDDSPNPSWQLALNGTMSPELTNLPPGHTAELSRELSIGGLAQGQHEISVRLGEHVSPVVLIDVA